MKDRVFFDTNVLIYAFSGDNPVKQRTAVEAIKKFPPIVSTQVLNECANIFLCKKNFAPEIVCEMIDNISTFFHVCPISLETVHIALDVRAKYGFSYYDCLIIASALQNNCTKLFSEDMQNGQVIHKKLQIVNIFTV